MLTSFALCRFREALDRHLPWLGCVREQDEDDKPAADAKTERSTA